MERHSALGGRGTPSVGFRLRLLNPLHGFWMHGLIYIRYVVQHYPVKHFMQCFQWRILCSGSHLPTGVRLPFNVLLHSCVATRRWCVSYFAITPQQISLGNSPLFWLRGAKTDLYQYIMVSCGMALRSRGVLSRLGYGEVFLISPWPRGCGRCMLALLGRWQLGRLQRYATEVVSSLFEVMCVALLLSDFLL